MTTTGPSDPSQPAPKGWSFDKFSEPRTFPHHWDLSEITVPANGSHRNGSGQAVRPSEPAGQVETGVAEEPPAWERDPFPQPRTYPAKWDLSG